MTSLVLLIVAALAFWVLGSLLLRLAGLAAIAGGLVAAASSAPLAAAGLLGVGVLSWLAGHWLFEFRNAYYASPLAQRLLEALRARPGGTHNNQVDPVLELRGPEPVAPQHRGAEHRGVRRRGSGC